MARSRGLLPALAALTFAVGCFRGEFMYGQPCKSDSDCGPHWQCNGVSCGVPKLVEDDPSDGSGSGSESDSGDGDGDGDGDPGDGDGDGDGDPSDGCLPLFEDCSTHTERSPGLCARDESYDGTENLSDPLDPDNKPYEDGECPIDDTDFQPIDPDDPDCQPRPRPDELCKCTPYAPSSSYDNWVGTRCVGVVPDGEKQAQGDPCTVGADGIDSCDASSVCLGASPDRDGLCVPIATHYHGCANDEVLTITNDGTLRLCLSACLPGEVDCNDEREACVWNGNDRFVCMPTTHECAYASSCDFINECAPNSVCIFSDAFPPLHKCNGNRCCANFCNEDSDCENWDEGGATCIEFADVDAPYPGTVKVCAVISDKTQTADSFSMTPPDPADASACQ